MTTEQSIKTFIWNKKKETIYLYPDGCNMQNKTKSSIAQEGFYAQLYIMI